VFFGYQGGLDRFQRSATSSSNTIPFWRRPDERGNSAWPATVSLRARIDSWAGGFLFLRFFFSCPRYLARDYPFRRSGFFFCSLGILNQCFVLARLRLNYGTGLGRLLEVRNFGPAVLRNEN
jgi:hypothetical protein